MCKPKILSPVTICQFFLLLCLSLRGLSQNVLQIIVKTGQDEPLSSATILWIEKNKRFYSDTSGTVIIGGISIGFHTFRVSYVGFEEKTVSYQYDSAASRVLEIQLVREVELEEEVIVTSTRTSRSIVNTPTRTEVISGEELAEKGNMKPGDIRMLLSESTGIQVQQTSATSFNAGIRIQGLDGRYTQILRDGYPLYSGFSSGLSILQIVPLDLKQVEVIKGSSSTLYGGGAIAGLVNLISKTPGSERVIDFLANVTSAGGLDLSGYFSEKFKNSGLTVFASRNSSPAYDPADIGLSAIPKFERYTVNPRLFLYGTKTTADVGLSLIMENRIGGDINFIRHGGTGFYEKNNTARVTTQAGINHQITDNSSVLLKNSYSRFERKIGITGYEFNAIQQSSFTEITWNRTSVRSGWVIGVNLITDDLQQEGVITDIPLDYHYNTYGAFVQNTWSAFPKFTLETGLRADLVNRYGFEILPRISAMYQFSPEVTTRFGGGLGYKTPTVFTEEAERIQFRNLLPINITSIKNERSFGGNWDVNYRTVFGSVGFSLNHLFFYTRLNRPLILVAAPNGKVEFRNASGHIDTRGMETNIKLNYNDFKLFIGYTYTDASTHFNGEELELPLAARHRMNNVLMYEIEDKLKLGLEGYYFSRQKLNDGLYGKSYWIFGFMAEKIWKQFSVFINFENFTDSRQTKFDTIYTGTIDNPVFRDIYAPVDGFLINGGLKVRL